MPSHIYLADQRGLVATPQQQRLSTFNFGPYQAAGRAAFGALLAFNEELLAPGQAVELPVAQPTHLLLLPLSSTVAFTGPGGLGGHVAAEQMQLLALPADTQVQLANPSPTEAASLLHIWLAAPQPVAAPATECLAYRFADLDNQLGILVPAGAHWAATLRLGCLQGRHEAVVQPAAGRLFVFVLAGAFEVAGCLLHAHDGLALWDCPEVELEALSNDALVLALELKR